MAGEIIRKGDSTSHGGTVLEGSMLDICHGKPIAFIGHKAHCPKCRGDFPIVEGAVTSNFYGKGVALAGMKTSCGAVLIASQFTDTVEWGTGSGGMSGSKLSSPHARDSAVEPNREMPVADASSANVEVRSFDDRFVLLDQDGEPFANAAYAILRASGQMEYGETDESGHTHLLSAVLTSEVINIYIAG